jgi:hypothetical protein
MPPIYLLLASHHGASKLALLRAVLRRTGMVVAYLM